MKRSWVMGILLYCIIVVLLFTVTSIYSYRIFQRYLPPAAQEEEEDTAVQTNNDVVPSGIEGYYLMEEGGYLIIYHQDKQTVYDYTRIPAETLPEEMRSRLEEGIYLNGQKELFDFLESHSS